MLQLRAGIDFDGVLTDPKPGWAEFFERADHPHDNLDLVRSPASYTGPEEVCDPCFQAALRDPDIALACELYPGVKRKLKLASLHMSLIGVTHRRPEVDLATRQWLHRNQIGHLFSDVHVMHGSKAKLAYQLRLHYHVDDSPNVAADFARYEAELRAQGVPAEAICRLIVVDRPYNQHASGFLRVPDLAGEGGALDFLIQEGIWYNDLAT